MSARAMFQGELGLLSLFDLAQLLMLNGATGTLHVTATGRKGFLRFERGQIANAVDERLQEGEEAAYRVFAWRSGAFEFRVEPASGGRTIHDSTEGLMLEAARRLDESSQGGERMTETLQSRAGKFEALRLAFQRVAADATTGGVPGAGARFAALRAPGDALLYRPGVRPRGWVGGTWQDLASERLSPTAYQQLCSTLLDGEAMARGDSVQTLAVFDDGRELRVTRSPAPHDALLVRLARLDGPATTEPGAADSASAAARLEGETARIESALDLTAGLLLIGAPHPGAADELLRAALAAMLERRPATVLLASERAGWREGEAAGAVVLASRNELSASLLAFAPDVVAFDVAHADLSLEALHRVPVVMCAVVAPDAGSLWSRWLARHGMTRADVARVPLAGADVALLYTDARGAVVSPLPVIAARSPLRAGQAAGSRSASEPLADLGAVIEGLQKELRKAA